MNDSHQRLRRQVLWLNEKWSDFCELFHSDQDDLKLLNNVASDFFGRLRDTLLFDIILHICRLTDPATQGSFENLTIRRWADPSDSKIQELLECTDRATEFARRLRNKRIAHHDFPDPSGNVVPLPSREQIQEAIDSIRKVISTFEQKHDIPPTCYDFVFPRWSGVDALKAVLRKGCDH